MNERERIATTNRLLRFAEGSFATGSALFEVADYEQACGELRKARGYLDEVIGLLDPDAGLPPGP